MQTTASAITTNRARAPGLAAAVRAGLLATPKRLPPWLLYDDAGSRLFEEITTLPEYYVTRTEREILAAHAGAIVAATGHPDVIVELGAGSATKTALVLGAALKTNPRLTFLPVDVSQAALDMAAAHLRDILPALAVRPTLARYPEELSFLNTIGGRRCVLFLGSNLGNYDPADGCALLLAVRRQLNAGDTLVLGVDRRKASRVLIPAYDDAAGVTAAFNLNVLARINRELGGRFDLEAFRHVALWNDGQSRMELYLESLRDQVVPVAALGVTVPFSAGERLHTENSYKFAPRQVNAMLAEAGFTPKASWSDARSWFSVVVSTVRSR